MDVLDGEDNLSNVEPRLIFLEDLLFVEMVGEVATWTIVENHVQVIGGLKAIMHFDYIGVGSLLQDVAFGDSVFQVLVSV